MTYGHILCSCTVLSCENRKWKKLKKLIKTFLIYKPKARAAKQVGFRTKISLLVSLITIKRGIEIIFH